MVFALLAGVLAVIIAYPVAYIMSFTKSKWVSQNLWILITLPIWIAMILKMVGLQTLFSIIAPNLLGTIGAVIIGMVYAYIPFVILPIYNSLDKINRDLISASKDLGASWQQTFRKIILFKTIPGVITGLTIFIIQASTSLLIVHYMGEGKINLITSIIQSYFFKSGNFKFTAAISLILTAFVIIILVINKVLIKKIFTLRTKNNKRGSY